MEYKDFGELLYELRKQKGYTEREVVDKMGFMQLKEINIKKWERDLEFPDLDMIYKLSEIYEVSSEQLLYSKDMTLKAGLAGIHKYIIRVISLMLGISIYGTIWLCRIVLGVTLILTLIWFYGVTKMI